MKNVRAFMFLGLALILGGCTSQPAKQIKDGVTIADGSVSGSFDESTGITTFKGIPFAAPPVGDLRWKAPQPVEPWEGVKECTEFSASAMQATPVPFMMWTQEYIAPKEPLSEDCLYLNVWTPAKDATEKRPVFVYIYGGGFSSGSGAVPIYDGEEMAKKGLVFITINYRVGTFGFLAHPELTAESPNHASGNYGLLDQVEALKWVNKNIAAFGGDPDNVTIGGQSAGAFSVNYLVASPLTKGLIHRAIAESGGAVLSSNALARGGDLNFGEEAGVKFAEELGVSSIEELRAKSAEEILAGGGFRNPIVDGYFLPKSVGEIFANGEQNDIPVIIGWNEDEGFGGAPVPADQFKERVKTMFGDKADAFLAEFPLNTDEEAFAIQNDLGALQTFGIQSYKWMLLQNEKATSKVFMYRFERDVPYAEGMTDFGAFHTSEVPYAYNNLKMSPRPWTEEDYKLADLMSDYWVNFATAGDPNAEGLPAWEAATPDNLKAMHFNLTSECGDLPSVKLLKFLDDLYSN
ncbi:carboxylesterase family protein [Draconibacterium sp. IB214405]|uniref:carboxylesterase/lipase family protein n=1 Tax=Draconibacterium sp. IB214405 TaxID=3097352 RepID=UPI002A142CCD|nr:carboxylesterase family protein [Draconibacterium sp. IB214405]MDX8338904.1 carboxylesterase family protein [Draconibacterium sp. IB214405]